MLLAGIQVWMCREVATLNSSMRNTNLETEINNFCFGVQVTPVLSACGGQDNATEGVDWVWSVCYCSPLAANPAQEPWYSQPSNSRTHKPVSHPLLLLLLLHSQLLVHRLGSEAHDHWPGRGNKAFTSCGFLEGNQLQGSVTAVPDLCKDKA